ncbi:MAG: glycosyltransferase family 4 protein [Planctomycetota bacterium]
MAIALICQPWDSVTPALQGSSIPIWTWQVARRLADQDAVFIYAKAKRGLPPVERDQGVTIRRIPVRPDRVLRPVLHRLSRTLHPGWPFCSGPMFYPLFYRRTLAAARADGCDILHIHNFFQYVPLARRLHRSARIVLHMHCDWLSRLGGRTVDRSIAAADAVIGCSEYITESTRLRCPAGTGKYHTVLNGVDVEAFEAADGQEDPAARAGPPRILFVGRFTPEKGLHVLVDAFTRLAQRWDDLTLDIVGGGKATVSDFVPGMLRDPLIAPLADFYHHRDYAAWLHRRIDAAGLTARVRFLGTVSQPLLLQIYREATLLAHPALLEPFGMVAAEAMAAGLPVVASRVGGLPEVVRHGRTGLMVAPGDPEALAEAIALLLADGDRRRRFAVAARQYARTHFSWSRVAARVRQVYGVTAGGPDLTPSSPRAGFRAPAPASGDNRSTSAPAR